LITVTVLTLVCVFVPLWLGADKISLKEHWALLTYFAGIGLGFMFVEISQMQRLLVFLGHPVYSLTTVMFTLLLSGGVGSYSTSAIGRPGAFGSPLARWLSLLCVVAVSGAITPPAISAFQGVSTTLRILIAAALLSPLGLVMGMAFPIGMQIAGKRDRALTPWLWGINGAMSVWASVFSVAIALTFNISSSFWAGFACYLTSFCAFLCLSRLHEGSV
jgi:hypothetical protein